MGPILKWTLEVCTAAATRRNMADLLLVMDDFNHQKVCKATWYTLNAVDEDQAEDESDDDFHATGFSYLDEDVYDPWDSDGVDLHGLFIRDETEPREPRQEETHPVILGISQQFVKDWRWAQIKSLFLIRYRGLHSEEATLASHCLTLLPDPTVRLVTEFVKPKEFKKARSTLFASNCECVGAGVYECPWHTFQRSGQDNNLLQMLRSLG